MGLYRRSVFPRLMDGAMGRARYRPVRQRVCSPLSGEVLEIGFGSGLNLPHLPAAVSVVLAVDPMEAGRALAAERLAAAAVAEVAVRFVGLDGADLDLPDDAADAALSTWTLCSIPDPVAAVREINRVVRPGGVLRFVEHGRSPDPRTATWQRRLTPIQRRLVCGCHLDRDIPTILRDGGMDVTDLDEYELDGESAVLGWTFEGAARAT